MGLHNGRYIYGVQSGVLIQNHPCMVYFRTFLANPESRHQIMSNHESKTHLSSTPYFLMIVFMILFLNADKRHIIIVVKNEVHGKGWLQINCRQLIYNHHNLQYQKAYSNGWNIIWDVLEKCKLIELKIATFHHRAILLYNLFQTRLKTEDTNFKSTT
jgi:hypothetical protein